jgi:hypothetical protein
MAGSYRVWSPLPLSMIRRLSDHRAMTSAILVIPPLVSIPLTAATLTLWVLVGRWADRLLRSKKMCMNAPSSPPTTGPLVGTRTDKASEPNGPKIHPSGFDTS